MRTAAPNVLVLGASGLLGGRLVERLSMSFPTAAVMGRSGAGGPGGPGGNDRRVRWLPVAIDAAGPATIARVLEAAGPDGADVVVNAIGARLQADSSVMAQTNGRFPHELAAAVEARGARLVHISTDGVFSGSRGEYAETDRPDPIDEYGRSKLAGELDAPHLTIRTSFFGRTPRGTGLIEWLVAHRGQAVDGFVDYRFSGMAVTLLADLVAGAIDAGLAGLYHVGGDAVTKYELLCGVAERMHLDVAVRAVSRGAIDRTLDSSRFFALTGRQRPTVAESLQALTTCGVLSRS